MKRIHFKTVVELIILVFLTASIPLIMYVAQHSQDIRGKAVTPPVVLTVDLAKSTPLSRNWQNLAQGGEVPIPQLPAVVEELSALSPRYIRIDHIFDSYGVVKKDDTGRLQLDFSLLDKEVDAIVKAGATPFFSLSYIPDDLRDAQNSERPVYNQWERLVEETVSHYSGKKGKSLKNVYYEVYNEPDVFGKWGILEYAQLYEFSLRGAQEATNVWPFSIGGPALSYFSSNFIREFLALLKERELRLDFISWHVYSTDPAKIANDQTALAILLEEFPSFKGTVKIISECGSFPQKHLWYDNLYGASHLVATVSRSLDTVDMLLPFEAKDGPSDKKFFGGWGILTNEKFGVEKKPRYYALWLLNKLKAFRYNVVGGDENLFAIASGNNEIDATILLTFYSFGKDGLPRTGTVSFTNMLPGIYQVSKTTLARNGLLENEDGGTFSVEKSEGSFDVTLSPDESMVVNLARISAAVHQTLGVTVDSQDKAASVSLTSPLIYLIPAHEKPLSTTVSFALLSNSSLTQLSDGVYVQSSSSTGTITLSKETQGFASVLSLAVVTTSGEQSRVSLPLSPSDPPRWHTVTATLNNTRALLSLSLDDNVSQAVLLPQGVDLGERLSIGGFTGAVDNLAVSVDGRLLLSDSF